MQEGGCRLEGRSVHLPMTLEGDGVDRAASIPPYRDCPRQSMGILSPLVTEAVQQWNQEINILRQSPTNRTTTNSLINECHFHL